MKSAKQEAKAGTEVLRGVFTPHGVRELRTSSDTVKLFMNGVRVELSIWVGYMLGVDVSFTRREASVYLDKRDSVAYYGVVGENGGEVKAADGVVVRVAWL